MKTDLSKSGCGGRTWRFNETDGGGVYFMLIRIFTPHKKWAATRKGTNQWLGGIKRKWGAAVGICRLYREAEKLELVTPMKGTISRGGMSGTVLRNRGGEKFHLTTGKGDAKKKERRKREESFGEMEMSIGGGIKGKRRP